jgi:hypothetical protein
MLITEKTRKDEFANIASNANEFTGANEKKSEPPVISSLSKMF